MISAKMLLVDVEILPDDFQWTRSPDIILIEIPRIAWPDGYINMI